MVTNIKNLKLLDYERSDVITEFESTSNSLTP